MLKQLLNGDLRDYRPIPFWSWNDKLEDNRLKEQIGAMKAAGIGGFFMHARGGLKTEYLGEAWFRAVKTCIDEAKKQNMNAWCYDENGWPSGFAGMKLLENPKNFAHYLTFQKKSSFDSSALAVYVLDGSILKQVWESRGPGAEYLHIYDHTNASVVDILNKRVVADFIRETHEKYFEKFSGEFGKGLRGFFTDEPQYFRTQTAFSPVLLEEYQAQYQEDLLERLGALFVDCDGAYEFRYRYWSLMNRLYTESFAKQIYEWCERHGCQLTGHSVEESSLAAQMTCCAGVMPFYEYEHIPGIDWLGRKIGTEICPRQASSVAQQLGKKFVMSETFATAGWDVTPKELKWIAEWQYVNGVNLMCHHLYPYSIKGQRKRDYPAFFSKHNPWTKNLKEFNDYFTRLGFLLAESEEIAKVAVIHPMHSAYLTYDRAHSDTSVAELDDGFAALVERLGAAQYGHHYVDETLLKKYGRVQDGKLIVGRKTYDYVALPNMQNIDSHTVEVLQTFVSQGGKLYLDGPAPKYVDGVASSLDFSEGIIGFDDLANPNIRIDDKNTEVRSTFRNSRFGDFLYVVNLSKDKRYQVHFTVKAKGAKRFDVGAVEYQPIFYEKTGESLRIPLSFNPGDSLVIFLSDVEEAPAVCHNFEKMQELELSHLKIKDVSQNALTVDYACLSYDNEHYSEPQPIMGVADFLLTRRENRTVFLKYQFEIEHIPERIYLECEPMEIESATLNGKALTNPESGSIEPDFLRFPISNLVKTGQNEIIFKISYYQNPHVYKTLFDTVDGTESLLNCLSYDTELDAIYILGDFSVRNKGRYWDTAKNMIMAEGGFAISQAKGALWNGDAVRSGYPFFAGSVTVAVVFHTDFNRGVLELEGRFALAEITLNGKKAGAMMFSNRCLLENLSPGRENTLEITLTNSNRNLLGPFHCKNDPEPGGLSPQTFEMRGEWQDGKCPLYDGRYALAHFGLDKIRIYGSIQD